MCVALSRWKTLRPVHGIIMLCHVQQKKLRHAHGAYTVRKTYRSLK